MARSINGVWGFSHVLLSTIFTRYGRCSFHRCAGLQGRWRCRRHIEGRKSPRRGKSGALESRTKSHGLRAVNEPLQQRTEVDPEANYLGDIESWRNDILPTVRLDTSRSSSAFDHRVTPRVTISLPIFIVVGGTRHNALLRNLSPRGAMIVTSAPLLLGMKIEFHCGAICTSGNVVWQRRTGSGIMFDQAICERQLSQQVSRSNAVASRCTSSPAK